MNLRRRRQLGAPVPRGPEWIDLVRARERGRERLAWGLAWTAVCAGSFLGWLVWSALR